MLSTLTYRPPAHTTAASRMNPLLTKDTETNVPIQIEVSACSFESVYTHEMKQRMSFTNGDLVCGGTMR